MSVRGASVIPVSLLVNCILFVIAGSVRLASMVCVATVLEWWFLSDYYMVGLGPWWTEWMDRYAFVFASAGTALLVAVAAQFSLWCRTARCLATQELPFFDEELPVSTWMGLLRHVEG